MNKFEQCTNAHRVLNWYYCKSATNSYSGRTTGHQELQRILLQQFCKFCSIVDDPKKVEAYAIAKAEEYHRQHPQSKMVKVKLETVSPGTDWEHTYIYLNGETTIELVPVYQLWTSTVPHYQTDDKEVYEYVTFQLPKGGKR